MKTILFDVDNTLYPKESALFNEVDSRINKYLREVVGIADMNVKKLRKEYLEKYGTTLNGLIKHHNVLPFHYLDYVHNVDIEKYISVNSRLKIFLQKSKYRHIIFSNAYLPYIRKILRIMEIEEYFEKIFDISKLNFIPKPLFKPYLNICKQENLLPDKTVMVDDSLKNLLTARKIGFKTLYINDKKHNDFDFTIKKIEEIDIFLEKLVDF